MNVIALHPEELIDRARHGALSADERARLDAHLAQCVACRFECAVQRDFSAAPPALPEVDGLQALVSGALQAAGKTEAPPVAASARARGTRARWLLPWAAALVLVSGVAAAQTGLIERALVAASTQVESLFAARRDAPSATPRAVRRRSVVTPSRAPQPEPAVQSAPGEAASGPPASDEATRPRLAPAPAPPARRATQAVKRSAPRVQVRDGASPASTRPPATPMLPGGVAPPYVPAAQVAPPASVVDSLPAAARPAEVIAASTPEPAPAQPSAATLFERANRLRRAGQARAAAASYGELATRHPHSPEARLSLVLLGRLELDRGAARQALARFDAYLATGEQALREQALAGRALSLVALARTSDACSAFDALLRAYPSSAYASKARARCTED